MVRCIHGDALRLVFFSKMKSLRIAGLMALRAAWAGAAVRACNNTSNGNNNGNDT